MLSAIASPESMYKHNPNWERQLTGHFIVSYRVRQDFCQIQEYPASLVKNLNTRLDLEIFSNSEIEGVEGRFTLPEEIGNVQHVGSLDKMLAQGFRQKQND